MIDSIVKTLLALLGLVGFAFAVVALHANDWPQAAAWLLFEISCTLTSLSIKETK